MGLKMRTLAIAIIVYLVAAALMVIVWMLL